MYTQECRRAANHLSDLLDSRLCSTDLEALAATLSAPTGERSWTRLVGTEDSDAWLIAWGEASEVAAHDHGGSHGAIQRAARFARRGVPQAGITVVAAAMAPAHDSSGPVDRDPAGPRAQRLEPRTARTR